MAQVQERPCAQCTRPTRGLPGALCGGCRELVEAAEWGRAIVQTIRDVRDRLPEKYRAVDLEGPEGDELRRRVKSRNVIHAAQAALTAGRSVTIQGNAGQGKTSTAAALLVGWVRRLIGPAALAEGDPGEGWRWARARSCRYLRALRIADGKVWRDGAHVDGDDLAAARDAAVLIVDDLGLEPVNTTTIELLHDRADRGAVTLVTTQLGEAKLAATYGDGTARRLLEDSAVIELPGWVAQ